MNLDRIEQGSAGTITVTLAAGGVPADPSPDSATVAIARLDGTTVASGSAGEAGVGVFAFPYTPAHTALLDVWVATWTFTTGGQQQTRKTIHEIAGGFLCTLGELAELFPSKTPAELAQIRTVAEQRVEGACGQAFVGRYALERHYGRRRIRLGWPHVRTVRSLTVGPAGSPYIFQAAALAALDVRDNVICLDIAGYGASGPALVGYEHGLDYPGEDIRTAALLAAQETQDTTGASRVVRREADGQAVTYASPSGSGGFVDPLLRSIVADNTRPLVA